MSIHYFQAGLQRMVRLALLIGGLLPLVAHSADVTMHGTLLVITCRVNNDNPVDVSFGDAVGVNRVDGKNYEQPIPLDVKCSSPPGDLFHLVFYGQPTDFDPGAVETNVSDLGIKLLKGGEAILLNQALPISFDEIPVLTAVPIKRTGSQLTSGKFKAIATLLVRIE
jgi:type 1 fimbria pilin